MHSCTKLYYHFRNLLLHRSMNGTTSSAHKNLNKFNFEDNIAKLGGEGFAFCHGSYQKLENVLKVGTG